MNNDYNSNQSKDSTGNNSLESPEFITTRIFIDKINQIARIWKITKTDTEKAECEKEAKRVFQEWSAGL